MEAWIAGLFQDRQLTRMGHHQRVEDRNLGLGWVYYGLARVVRPAHVVVIGSYRGFVPLVLGRALQDNGEGGTVHFIDPSLVDDFWKDPDRVRAYFRGHGIDNVRHYLQTTQEFTASQAYRDLPPVGLVFVDGYHSEEQVRIDYEAFRDRMTPQGILLFHDSIRFRVSRMYGPDKVYVHQVKTFLDGLKMDGTLQVFDLPFGDGVTLVRKKDQDG